MSAERGADAGSAASPAKPLKTCACGYSRGHLMVSPEPKHSGWAHFWVIFMGVTAPPYRVEFRCRVCKQTFDSTDDPEECKKYI